MQNTKHDSYIITRDIEEAIATLRQAGDECDIQDRGQHIAFLGALQEAAAAAHRAIAILTDTSVLQPASPRKRKRSNEDRAEVDRPPRKSAPPLSSMTPAPTRPVVTTREIALLRPPRPAQDSKAAELYGLNDREPDPRARSMSPRARIAHHQSRSDVPTRRAPLTSANLLHFSDDDVPADAGALQLAKRKYLSALSGESFDDGYSSDYDPSERKTNDKAKQKAGPGMTEMEKLRAENERELKLLMESRRQRLEADPSTAMLPKSSLRPQLRGRDGATTMAGRQGSVAGTYNKMVDFLLGDREQKDK